MKAIICIWVAAFGISTFGASTIAPVELRCEYVRQPLGVDSAAPRLFWKLRGDARGQRQTAYQVVVASSPELLARGKGDLWDSGKVPSGETTHIRYSGEPLRSSQQVFWKVRCWDEVGRESGWSKPASWTMGLLARSDWHARWIGAVGFKSTNQPVKTEAPPTILLRREFVVKPRLKRALAQVCGLGSYELTLNGHKVGDALFPPGWTKYDKTCLYDAYDITGLLRSGNNAAGLLLANGMYNVTGGRYTKFKGSFGPLCAIAQLRLEYADGSIDLITTDQQWRWLPGPITFSCVFGGEDYDARLEPRGWSKPGFDASNWREPVISEGPGGKLKGLSCSAPPIRAYDVLKPVRITRFGPSTAVYDLGQNASLMPRLRVHGPPGGKVRIIPAELVTPEGKADRGSCGHNRPAYWEYTLCGSGRETWFPKFYYHGARYLQVEAFPGPAGALPVVDSLEGVVVHSSSEAVGDFDCANPLFNRIRTLVRWAQRSNMMSVMTDCPHREKLGWLEEDHLNGPSLRYEFALDQLFTKMLNDMADSQLDDGLVPDIAPEYVQFKGGFRDSPEWGSAVLLVPWQQYEFSGDLDLLRKSYRPMQRYVDYLSSRAQDHIVSHGLGDWYDLGPKPPGIAQLTPVALTATAFYYYDAFLLGETAALLGKTADAGKYRALAGEIREAFNREFLNRTNHSYATGSQCANAIALVMNLAEPADRPDLIEAIVRDVRSRGNGLSAGDVGYRYLLRALADGGRSDLIFDINNQSEKPGYGYQLKQGATSLTEAWDARRGSSQNHFMLGQIMEWFYHDLAGIAPDPSGPGFEKIIIKPAPVADLAWVRASYNSIHGPIVSRWERKSGGFRLDVTIPVNTTATIFVPSESAERITESGKPAGRQKHVQFVRQETGYCVFAVGSGRYRFQAPQRGQ